MSFFQKAAGRFLLGCLAVLFGIGVVLRIFFVEPVTVAHNAMAPTLIHGDVVLVWRGATPERGDMVVCRHPNEERFVMGRVIALDGEHVDRNRDQLTINGVMPIHDYRGTISFFDTTERRAVTMRWGIESLGTDDHYFFEQLGRSLRVRPVERVRGLHLLGDNRAYHDEDSRDFGDVDPATCIGQVFMRWSPAPDVDLGGEIPHGWLELVH